jgi:2,3-bisphosphoglycerate-independent phosphoglycerate mutase
MPKKVRKKKIALIILDGFGLVGFKNIGNAITPETAPHILGYMKKYPSTKLKASGKYVGLRPGQKGNSEAGHLNIGAGRVVEQDLVTISKAIKNGTFFKNPAFKEAVYHAKKNKSTIHVLGLLTNMHSAHASEEHLHALLKFLKKQKCKKVYLHLFTDGRDSPPNSALQYLNKLKPYLKGGFKIASISGRFYAMDRNKIWDRTRKVYDLIVSGRSKYTAFSPEDAITEAYSRGESDEYVKPTVITHIDGSSLTTVKDKDVIYFFNARSDRARQLTKAITQPDFQKQNKTSFRRERAPKNIRFVAMTDFGPDLPNVITAFPSPNIRMPLAKVIGEEYNQLYISETEKYAHVTYFMNGGHSKPVNGEHRELVKSGCHYSYVDKPQMHCKDITTIVIDCFKQKKYNFICVNYPNADMVAHTGNFEATKRAIKFLDIQVKKLVTYMLKHNGQVLIVADHGNAEEMIYKKTKGRRTEHTANKVPFILIEKHTKIRRLKKGKLADVAPTLLKMMQIKKPKEMTGKPLF